LLGRPGQERSSVQPNSSAQVIAALKARGADMQFMETTDGKIKKADRENLEAVDDELAEAILEYRSEYKVLSTYVRPMIGRHYDTGLRVWKEPFISHATAASTPTTARSARARGACRAPTRTCRTSRATTCACATTSAPRRARARRVRPLEHRDAPVRRLRRQGPPAGGRAARRDLHTLTAKFIGIKDRKRAGGYIESARQRGKTFNFSIIYGGGLRTIRKQQRVNRTRRG
jgi:hypothetical protein